MFVSSVRISVIVTNKSKITIKTMLLLLLTQQHEKEITASEEASAPTTFRHILAQQFFFRLRVETIHNKHFHSEND